MFHLRTCAECLSVEAGVFGFLLRSLRLNYHHSKEQSSKETMFGNLNGILQQEPAFQGSALGGRRPSPHPRDKSLD